MKTIFSRFIAILGGFTACYCYAGIPVWTFQPLTETHLVIATGEKAIVQYLITNQSRKTHHLGVVPILGISQLSGNNNCPSPFTLGHKESCVLTLEINGSLLQADVFNGPIVCQVGNPLECYRPSIKDNLYIQRSSSPLPQALLSVSAATRALQVSGVPRTLTITNIGTETAYNVSYDPSPSFPAGTTVTPSSCGIMVAGSSCLITIIPGPNPSAAPGDTNPQAIELRVQGDNTNLLTPTINVLAYGSVYQGGYIFAFDDSTPPNTNVGGKVFALEDQVPFPPGVIWSSNGSGGQAPNVANDNIPGIYNTSTSPPDACNGNLDGECNTNVIITYYSPPQTNPAVNLSYYAAGNCRGNISGYSDWYLPAICELGYDSLNTGSGCGTQIAPTTQNVQSNLIDQGIPVIGPSTQGVWSSTEYSFSPSNGAWLQNFVGIQTATFKNSTLNVRCVRKLTP